jgi:hypothetical protein
MTFTIDTTPPTLLNLVGPSQLDDGILDLGGTNPESAILSYSGSFSDDISGFDYFNIQLINLDTGNYKYFSVNDWSSDFDSTTGNFTADIDFTWAAAGEWTVDSAWLTDKAGNQISYWRGNDYSSDQDLQDFLNAGIDLTSNVFNFTVINPNQDTTPPTLLNLVGPSQLDDGILDLGGTNPESAILSYSGSFSDDISGFDYFNIQLINLDTGNYKYFSVNDWSSDFDSTTGNFTADIDFTWAAAGEWTVDSAWLTDKAGNQISYWRGNDDSSDQDLQDFLNAGIDLTSNVFNFTVINPNQDTTPPTLLNLVGPSQLDDGILDLGGTNPESAILSYSGSFSDDISGFDYFNIQLINLDTGNYKYFSVNDWSSDFDSTTGNFTADIDFTWAAAGEWTVDSAWLTDKAGNQISYWRGNDDSSDQNLQDFLNAGIDLTSNVFNFTVINPNQDTTPPTLLNLVGPSQLDDGILDLGGTNPESAILSYSGSFSDDISGFDYFNIQLINLDTGNYKYFSINDWSSDFDSTTGNFTADIDFTWAAAGEWTVDSAWLTDKAGNQISYWRDNDDSSDQNLQDFLNAGIDLTSNVFNFTVINPNQDTTPPTLLNLIGPSQLDDGILDLGGTNPESAILSYSGSFSDDISGFDYFNIQLINLDTGNYKYFSVNDWSSDFDSTTGNFTADIDFTWAAAGEWTVDSAWLTDKAGNQISYWRDNDDSSDQNLQDFLNAGIDLTSNVFNFTVINPNQDTTPPTLLNLVGPSQLDDGILDLGGTNPESAILSYSGSFSDDISGFDYFNIQLINLDTGNYKYFSINDWSSDFDSTTGNFTADIDFTWAAAGEWTVDSAWLTDKAGNQISYWRDNDDSSDQDLQDFLNAGIDLTSNVFNFTVINPNQDTTPPTLLNLIGPSQLDDGILDLGGTNPESAILSYSGSFSDDTSGFDYFNIDLINLDTGNYKYFSVNDWSSDFDSTTGNFTADIDFTWAAAGEWTVDSAWLTDKAGNQISYWRGNDDSSDQNLQDFLNAGIDLTSNVFNFTVINPNQDTTPPTLLNLIGPSQLDDGILDLGGTNPESAILSYSGSFSDDISGFDYFNIDLINLDTGNYKYFSVNDWSSDFDSTTGNFTADIDFTWAAAGEWTVDSAWLTDKAGNQISYWRGNDDSSDQNLQDFLNAGIDLTSNVFNFTVINPNQDTTPPTLLNLVGPSQLDDGILDLGGTNPESAILSYSGSFSDDISGFDYFNIQLINLDTGNYKYFSINDWSSDFDSTTGNFTADIDFTWAAAGEWTVDSAWLTDKAGNQISYWRGNDDSSDQNLQDFLNAGIDLTSNVFNFTVINPNQDTTPPALIPEITSIGGADSIISSQSGDNTVVGTAEASREVSIFFGDNLLGTTTANGSGGFSYALSAADLTTIGEGSNKTITAQQTDGAGNTGSSEPFSFVVDTTAPDAPSVA